MTKEWTCTQCGDLTAKSLVGHARQGAPRECPNCGNEEFDETSLGSVHGTLDRILP